MTTLRAVPGAAFTLSDLAREAIRLGTATDQFLGRCRPLVRAIILDRVRDPDTADDLTQETLGDVIGSLHRLRDADSCASWLRSIAINRCRMWWRRPAPEPAGLEGGCEHLSCEDTFARAARRETWRELHAALAELPELSRLALLMHAIEGESYAHIAQALGVTVGSVGVRIHRARARLAKTLERAARVSEPEV